MLTGYEYDFAMGEPPSLMMTILFGLSFSTNPQ